MTTKKLEPLTILAAELLKQWHSAKTQLDHYKELEWQLRMNLVAQITLNTQVEGTTRYDIGSNWELKIVKKMNYSATNANGATENLMTALDVIDHALPVELIKWSPDLSISTYKKRLIPLLNMYPALRIPAANAIIIKPGAPEVELVPPPSDTGG